MGVGLIKPVLDSTDDLLDTIRVSLFQIRGGQPIADMHMSQRPTGQSTSDWNRAALVSVKSSTGEHIEDQKIISASPDSRQSRS